jgi:cytochrome c oxidase assembly protein subunit 15
MALLSKHRTASYKPGLFGFCIFTLGWITLLLYAGGFTTSIKAGMAFLDWPLSNGSVNPDGWLSESDKLAEHSHRLLGMKIGLLSIALLAWTWLRETRASVRRLAGALVCVVILQGLLGGARVRFDWLNTQAEHNLVAQSFAVAHACGAQIVLGTLVAITLMSTRAWIEGRPTTTAAVPKTIRTWGGLACIGLFLQVLIGAIMRHADAGLAIIRFPLARPGSLFPAEWNFDISIHFAHRVWAIGATLLIVIFVGKIWGHRPTRQSLRYAALFLLFLLAVQIYLGALTIWTIKNPYVATMHALIGAFLLATTWGLTLFTHRPSQPH